VKPLRVSGAMGTVVLRNPGFRVWDRDGSHDARDYDRRGRRKRW